MNTVPIFVFHSAEELLAATAGPIPKGRRSQHGALLGSYTADGRLKYAGRAPAPA
jgi:hypothetical protein